MSTGYPISKFRIRFETTHGIKHPKGHRGRSQKQANSREVLQILCIQSLPIRSFFYTGLFFVHILSRAQNGYIGMACRSIKSVPPKRRTDHVMDFFKIGVEHQLYPKFAQEERR